MGDLGSVPGLGRSPEEENGNPLQYSCLENPHGQRSLAGYSPWGRKESDTTEATKHNKAPHSTAQRHLAAQMGGRDRVTKHSSAITQVGTPAPGENGKVGAARGVLLV